MYKARAFFFVCAGLLCLALSYHFGARSAGAQSAGSMEGANFAPPVQGVTPYWIVSFVVNRVLYTSYLNPLTNQWQIPALPAFTVPGTAPVAATNGEAGYVLLANGDVYMGTQYGGNLLGGAPTPAQSISIGQLKAKYATPQGKAGKAPGDR
jgi:hypothetical protein